MKGHYLIATTACALLLAPTGYALANNHLRGSPQAQQPGATQGNRLPPGVNEGAVLRAPIPAPLPGVLPQGGAPVPFRGQPNMNAGPAGSLPQQSGAAQPQFQAPPRPSPGLPPPPAAQGNLLPAPVPRPLQQPQAGPRAPLLPGVVQQPTGPNQRRTLGEVESDFPSVPTTRPQVGIPAAPTGQANLPAPVARPNPQQPGNANPNQANQQRLQLPNQPAGQANLPAPVARPNPQQPGNANPNQANQQRLQLPNQPAGQANLPAPVARPNPQQPGNANPNQANQQRLQLPNQPAGQANLPAPVARPNPQQPGNANPNQANQQRLQLPNQPAGQANLPAPVARPNPQQPGNANPNQANQQRLQLPNQPAAPANQQRQLLPPPRPLPSLPQDQARPVSAPNTPVARIQPLPSSAGQSVAVQSGAASPVQPLVRPERVNYGVLSAASRGQQAQPLAVSRWLQDNRIPPPRAVGGPANNQSNAARRTQGERSDSALFNMLARGDIAPFGRRGENLFVGKSTGILYRWTDKDGLISTGQRVAQPAPGSGAGIL